MVTVAAVSAQVDPLPPESIFKSDGTCLDSAVQDHYSAWRNAGLVSALLLAILIVIVSLWLRRVTRTIRRLPHLLAVLLGIPLSVLVPLGLQAARRFAGYDFSCSGSVVSFVDYLIFLAVFIATYVAVGGLVRWLRIGG